MPVRRDGATAAFLQALSPREGAFCLKSGYQMIGFRKEYLGHETRFLTLKTVFGGRYDKNEH